MKQFNTNFEFLGEDFQMKAVKALVEIPNLFTEMKPIIDQNYFTEKGLNVLVGVMIDYYNKSNVVPHWSVIDMILRGSNRPDDDAFIQLAKLRDKDHIKLDGIDWVKTKMKEFCLQQQVISIANSMLEDIRKEKKTPEKIIQKTSDRLNKITIETAQNDGINPIDAIDAVLASELNERIPINVAGLDIAGLPKRGVSMLVASYGAGKTSTTTIIGQNVALQGKNVVQIVFEDGKENIAKMHYAKLLGMNRYEIDKKDNEELIKLRVETHPDGHYLKENLIIKECKRNETSVEDIKAYLMGLINSEGFIPDLVIIDYMSCLKMSSNPMRNKWEAEERCIAKIENMAKDLNIAVLLAEQTNRGGIQSPSADTLQGSIAKLQVCWTVLWLFKDKETQQYSLRVDKERGGRNSGKTYENINIDFGKLTLDCTDSRMLLDEASAVLDEIYKNR